MSRPSAPLRALLGAMVVATGALVPGAARAEVTSPVPIGAASSLGGLRADSLVLTDGSRIKGRLRSMENGELVMETEFSDPISVGVWNVAALGTDEAVQVVLSDGTLHVGRISTVGPGRVAIVAGTPPDTVHATWLDVEAVYRHPARWSGSLTVGGSLTDGNAEVIGAATSASVSFTSEEDRLTASADVRVAFAADTRVAQNGTATLQYDRFLTPRFYLHASEEVDHNRFQDQLLRSVTSLGAGVELDLRPGRTFALEGGAGYLVERFQREDDAERISARGRVKVRYPVGTRALITNDLVVYQSVESSERQLRNQGTVELKLVGDWGLKFEVKALWDSDPSPVAEARDVQATLGVSWSF